VEVNGKIIFNAISTTAFTYGKIGLSTWYCPIWLDDVEVVAESKQFPTGIQILKSQEMVCYPNPLTQGELNIQLIQPDKNIQLKIFNMSGQMIWGQKYEKSNSLSVPSEIFQDNGMYIIQVTTNNNLYKSKILYSGN